MAAAIARYAADKQLRHDHGAAGRRRVLAEFTLERMAERYVELYENELDKKAAANRFGWLRLGDASRPAGPTRNRPD